MTDMAKIVVGVGDMKVSADPSACLITYSLGSCVGVVGHDPVAKVAGLLHFQLPSAKGHDARAAQSPAMFGDKGIPLLLDALLAHGCRRERLVVRVFGGASMMNDNDLFKIGIKNARAAKKILWQSCMSIRNEDLGGEDSRTVSVEVGSGRVLLKKKTGEICY
jgi:chemotaxis protein CheD